MRALLSVYDKTGLDKLAAGLIELGFEIVSTGGSLAYLASHGISALPVEQVTGFPEMLDGRVKTLHPRIHGGLLARRDLERHEADLAAHGIDQIDVIAVNLYPFERTISDPASALNDALENIDIGGPAMIRAAAKNFPAVLVLTRPDDYGDALQRLQTGTADETYRRTLAAQAFRHVSLYDSIVAAYLGDTANQPFTGELTIPARLAQPLRYGENPHQAAAAYHRPTLGSGPIGILSSTQIQGKDLSYNNLLDADAAIRLSGRFTNATAAIIKHTVPCGVASRSTAAEAFVAALDSDPVSAYGGIVAINRSVDEATATALNDVFLEVVVAPSFTGGARAVLAARKNVRLLELPIEQWEGSRAQSVRSIVGGLLIQDEDLEPDSPDSWRVVTRASPSPKLMSELNFAWETCRCVRSNAIVLARDRMLVGVGPGQPNRVDSVRIAIQRAGSRVAGTALASDAFFPFADGVEVALAAGVAAVIQPGGSVRDAEVIEACDRASVPMVFTGVRHFLH